MSLKNKLIKFIMENGVGLRPAKVVVNPISKNYSASGSSTRRCTFPISTDKVNKVFTLMLKDNPVWVEELTAHVIYTDPVLLPTWDDTDELSTIPDVLDAPFSCMMSDYGDRIYNTEWVLFFEDQRIETVLPTPSAGWSNVGGITRYVKVAPDPMPVGVVRAIQITRGSNSDSEGVFGALWYLYQDPMITATIEAMREMNNVKPYGVSTHPSLVNDPYQFKQS